VLALECPLNASSDSSFQHAGGKALTAKQLAAQHKAAVPSSPTETPSWAVAPPGGSKVNFKRPIETPIALQGPNQHKAAVPSSPTETPSWAVAPPGGSKVNFKRPIETPFALQGPQ
jgi:hypothetical protein